MNARTSGATRVLLVRHGQSTWNADNRWQGQADPPLSAHGERQAREAAGRLAGVDALWASDLQRARRTAELIADGLGLGVHLDARLRERHAGPWQGLVRDEIEAGWPGFLEAGHRPPDYEPDDELVGRALAALDDLAAAHEGQHVVVVTHGGVVRALERRLGDGDTALLSNLSGRTLVRDGDGWILGPAVALIGADSMTTPGQL